MVFVDLDAPQLGSISVTCQLAFCQKKLNMRRWLRLVLLLVSCEHGHVARGANDDDAQCLLQVLHHRPCRLNPSGGNYAPCSECLEAHPLSSKFLLYCDICCDPGIDHGHDNATHNTPQ